MKVKKFIKILQNLTQVFYPHDSHCLQQIGNAPLNPQKLKKQSGNIVVLFDYGNACVRKAVLKLKSKGLAEYSELFANALLSYILTMHADKQLWSKESFAIAPVPLHKAKVIKRGFNQSELVLKSMEKLAKEYDLNLKFSYRLLRRDKNTKDQKLLNKKERLQNMENAFSARANILTKLKTDNIILIDDMVTTGATLSEAKRALRRSGFKGGVILIALAGKNH